MLLSETDFNMRAAMLLVKWRQESGITQEELAREFDITRRTICNLESGYSNLKLYTIMHWAHATKHDPIMAIPEILGLHLSSDSLKIMSGIINRIKTFREDEMHGISYIFFGDHGSDLRAFIHLCVAYLKCPLRDRQNISLTIINNYKNAKELNELVCPDSFEPDISLLEKAQEEGRQAYLKSKRRYYVPK